MTTELTLENIRTGAFPSDAHAVGFLLGEIEQLRKLLDGKTFVTGNEPAKTWEFDRYVNGRLMAEGVGISRAETFEQACRAAVALASSGSVLVVRQSSEPCEQRMTDAKAADCLATLGFRATAVQEIIRPTQDASRDLSASESASFHKTLARSPRIISQGAPQAINSIDDVAAICHSVTGLCCHILGSPGGPCTIGNCAAVRGYLGGPEFAVGASRDASPPYHVDATGMTREPPHCPTCDCGTPADLVGALQDVVHTDPGPVRAGKAYREPK